MGVGAFGRVGGCGRCPVQNRPSMFCVMHSVYKAEVNVFDDL
jgi:hypothetical protein